MDKDKDKDNIDENTTFLPFKNNSTASFIKLPDVLIPLDVDEAV